MYGVVSELLTRVVCVNLPAFGVFLRAAAVVGHFFVGYALTAQELCDRLQEHIHECDVLLDCNVEKLAKKDGVFEIVASGEKITARYVVLAIGKGHIVPNKLPLPNATKFENKTLFYTLKDCHILQDKNVVIAGGGDSTIDWACELIDIAKSITIIHRRRCKTTI